MSSIISHDLLYIVVQQIMHIYIWMMIQYDINALESSVHIQTMKYIMPPELKTNITVILKKNRQNKKINKLKKNQTENVIVL